MWTRPIQTADGFSVAIESRARDGCTGTVYRVVDAERVRRHPEIDGNTESWFRRVSGCSASMSRSRRSNCSSACRRVTATTADRHHVRRRPKGRESGAQFKRAIIPFCLAERSGELRSPHQLIQQIGFLPGLVIQFLGRHCVRKNGHAHLVWPHAIADSPLVNQNRLAILYETRFCPRGLVSVVPVNFQHLVLRPLAKDVRRKRLFCSAYVGCAKPAPCVWRLVR